MRCSWGVAPRCKLEHQMAHACAGVIVLIKTTVANNNDAARRDVISATLTQRSRTCNRDGSRFRCFSLWDIDGITGLFETKRPPHEGQPYLNQKLPLYHSEVPRPRASRARAAQNPRAGNRVVIHRPLQHQRVAPTRSRLPRLNRQGKRARSNTVEIAAQRESTGLGRTRSETRTARGEIEIRDQQPANARLGKSGRESKDRLAAYIQQRRCPVAVDRSAAASIIRRPASRQYQCQRHKRCDCEMPHLEYAPKEIRGQAGKTLRTRQDVTDARDKHLRLRVRL